MTGTAFTRGLLGLAAAALLAGCGGLQVNLRQAAAATPGNVAALFSVQTAEGQPLTELTGQSIQVFEDDELVPAAASKQTLLPTSETVAYSTLLLLDLGLLGAGEAGVKELTAALESLALRLAKHHAVGVYAFDGGADLVPLAEFSREFDLLKKGIGALPVTRVRDPSINLFGAVVAAVGRLRQQKQADRRPIQLANLVLLSASRDMARRATQDAMREALKVVGVRPLVVGLGPGVNPEHLQAVADGEYLVARVAGQQVAEGEQPALTLTAALQKVGGEIMAEAQKLQLLSYCSPLRSGKHWVRVKIQAGEASGELTFEVDAAGFGPGCDPYKVPGF